MVLVVAQCRCFFAAAFLFAGSKKRVEREREFVLFLCGRLIFLNKIFSHHDLHFFSLFYFFFCFFFVLVVDFLQTQNHAEQHTRRKRLR